ncbi:MAG: DnaD domain protein, partial [Oscillospiraceae bacterium]
GTPISLEDVAKNLCVLTGDVRQAVEFWETKGIEFIKYNRHTEDEDLSNIIQQQPLNPTPQQQQEIKKTVADFKVSPISRAEVNKLMKEDNNIRFLVEEAQVQIGKLLNQQEIETLVSLYTYCGISIDVILMAIGYCRNIDKCNMNYIKRVVLNWNENGIDDLEKAEKYIILISKTFENENTIKSSFGIDRKLSSKEVKLADKWISEFGFDIKMIRLAYERTIDNIGNMSFSYIDAILTSWNKDGVKTPKDAQEQDKKRLEGKGNSFSPKQNKDSAFGNSSFDMNDINKLIMK